jgi:hypothetical protein
VIGGIGPQGLRFGPFALTARDRVHRLQIQGRMRQESNWVQAVLEDESQAELIETQRDMWDESGTDSDGPWHESDLSAGTHFVLKKPGNYYVRLYAEPDPGTRLYGAATVSFSIRQEVFYPVYFACFGFGAAALGALFLFAGAGAKAGRVWEQAPPAGEGPARA